MVDNRKRKRILRFRKPFREMTGSARLEYCEHYVDTEDFPMSSEEKYHMIKVMYQSMLVFDPLPEAKNKNERKY